MPPNKSSQSTRRRLLRALGAAGFLGIAGCSGDDDTDEATPPPETPTETPLPTTPTETQTATPDHSPSPSPSPSEGSQPSPTESPDQRRDPWGDIEPTGVPAYADDPNWRMLGHDLGNTFTNPHASGPSDDPSVRWSIERDLAPAINGNIIHDPLIVDGTVYTTFQTESTQGPNGTEQWDFIAIDADTGEMETIFSVEGRLQKPTIVDGTVYVGVGYTVRAYDLQSGEERWRSEPPTETDREPALLNTSAIRYIDGVVIATDNINLQNSEGDPLPQHYGFDSETGEMLWKAVGDGDSPNNARLPLVVDGVSLYPKTDTMRDIKTGEERVALMENLDFPALHDGELYGLAERDGERVLVSYDWETLEERWTLTSNKRISTGCPVAFDNILVVSGTYENLGVDRETGEILWHTRPSEEWEDDAELGSEFRPATGDTVYVVHLGGAVTALNPTDGSIKWQLRTDEMDWNLVHGCALADDLLVTVGVDGKVYGIS
jgi:outer membrane protein assembly factor BamB